MFLANWNPTSTREAVHAAEELDSDLLARCRVGDRMALEQFVRCYERRVFAFLSRSLGLGNQIDDLAQEVFLRAYRNIQKFDPDGPSRLSTWLLSIAVNVAINVRRRSRTQASAQLANPELKTNDNPEVQLWRQELNTAMARAAAELPPEQRDTFILAEYHQLSVSEIAQVMGTRAATVKTRLFRAKMHLRNTLATLWEATR